MPFDLGVPTFGDVILVPVPFTDQTATKKRPAIVISSKDYNAARPDNILMAVTSQLQASAGFGEVWLTDWEAAGLLKPSAAKPVLTTIEHSLVIKWLGRLSDGDIGKLRDALQQIIDFKELV